MLPHPKAIGLILLVAGAAATVGTGAFSAVSADRTASVSVAGDSSALLQLQPHGENSGATLKNGQLKLEKLNIDSTTDYGDGVFKITNQGTQPVGVWITDKDENGNNHTDKITFYNNTFGGAAKVSSGADSLACENGVKSIENKANAVELGVGETLVVDLKVVTDGVTKAKASVLTGMIIHADATVDGVSEATGSLGCTGESDDSSDSGDQNNVDLVRDTDGDTMDDKTEEAIGLDPKSNDTDGDGISDTNETTKLNGDGPGYEVDTDGDGAIDANDRDADGDGTRDKVEGTGDTDSDTIPNYRDPDSDGSATDSDNDGLTNSEEETLGTDSNDEDSDNDGINDSVETNGGSSINTDRAGLIDALDDDSDGDGIDDDAEGTTDTDGDSTANYRDTDSDGDSISDSQEGTNDDDGDGTARYLDADRIRIEIKPDGDHEPDPINPNSKGKIPVAVYNTTGFNVTTINVSSLRFGAPSTVDNGNGGTPTTKNPKFKDADEDGDDDLIVKFSSSGTGFTENSDFGKLIGKTSDGGQIADGEPIKISGPSKNEDSGDGNSGDTDNEED